MLVLVHSFLFLNLYIYLGEAVKKNPTFLTLRKLDVAKDIAAIIAKSQSKVYLPADILLLNNLGITSTTQLVSAADQNLTDADSFLNRTVNVLTKSESMNLNSFVAS